MKDNVTQVLGFIAVFIILPILGYIVSIYLQWNFGWMAVVYVLFISHATALMLGSWLTTRDNREVVSHVMKALERKSDKVTINQQPSPTYQNGDWTNESGDMRLFS